MGVNKKWPALVILQRGSKHMLAYTGKKILIAKYIQRLSFSRRQFSTNELKFSTVDNIDINILPFEISYLCVSAGKRILIAKYIQNLLFSQ